MISNSIFEWPRKKNLENLAVVTLFISLLYTLRYSLPKTPGVNYFEKAVLLLISFLFLLITLKYGFLKIKNNKLFLFLILLLGLGLRVIWNLYADTQPISDFQLMYETAQELVNGNYNALNTNYFDLWTYNIPFVLYEFIILKLINSIWALKALNIVFSLISVFLSYRIGKSITKSEEGGKVAAFIFSTFPPLIIYTSVLTNQTLSIVFILFAIDSYVRMGSTLKTGIFFGLAQSFRPTAILFLGGFILYVLLQKSGFTLEAIKRKMLSILQLIVPYYLVLFIINLIITTANLSSGSLFHNAAPNYKLLVGLNPDTSGQYSYTDANLVTSLNEEEFSKKSKELIAKRLSSFKDVIFLLDHKFQIMWSNNDASTQWAGVNTGSNLNMAYYNILLLCCVFSLILFFKYRPEFFIFFVYVLLAAMIIYLIIEIQTRYRYELYIPMVFLSAFGLAKICDELAEQKN